MGKSVGGTPLGRQRHKWADIIKMDFTGIEWDGLD
jgi:hypothetical protein